MRENVVSAVLMLLVCLIFGALAAYNEPFTFKGTENALTRLDTPLGRWLLTGISGVASVTFGWMALRQYFEQHGQQSDVLTLPPHDVIQSRLKSNIQFTDAELAANQRGELSDRQKDYFITTLNPHSWWPYVAFMTVFFIGLVVYILVWSDVAETVRNHTPTLMILVGLIVSPTVVMLVTAVWARWKTNRIDRWRVRVVEGQVRLSESEHDVVMVPVRAYRLKIGRRTFNLSGTQAKAFIHGARYRIYFVRGWIPTILSAEFVPTVE